MRLKSSEAITFCVPVWMSVWLVKADLFLDGSAEGVVVVVVVVVLVFVRSLPYPPPSLPARPLLLSTRRAPPPQLST